MAASPWTVLHAQLHHTLKQRRLTQPRERLLIAVSGGQDSLCLARLLLDLQPKWHWELAIAHCDHRWRPDSVANAKHVQTLSQAWQLPFFEHVAAHPPANEAEARHWRYDCLKQTAITAGYSTVITGHTASDRAETLLYNLIRGSGMDGLQALTWKRSLAPGIQLIRPLLEVSRARVTQFCHEQALPVWEDTTNQDRHYRRNRIRLELLPYLQTHFNPQVESTLAQTAELLQAEVEYLEAATTELYEQSVSWSAENRPTRLNRVYLQTAPLALQRRTVRRVLSQLLPTTPRFEHIEKTVALITAPNRTQTDPFPGGAIAQVEDPWIAFRWPDD